MGRRVSAHVQRDNGCVAHELPVWEDAVDGGLVERVSAGQKTLVQLTGAGRDLLSAERP
jgi:hypothetical protein